MIRYKMLLFVLNLISWDFTSDSTFVDNNVQNWIRKNNFKVNRREENKFLKQLFWFSLKAMKGKIFAQQK